MGQLITVTVRPTASPSVRIFDLDRSLTGMAIERYASVDDVHGGRPPDVLARRLFDLGATSVTVYSSAVSVAAATEQWDELRAQGRRDHRAPLRLLRRRRGLVARLAAGDRRRAAPHPRADGLSCAGRAALADTNICSIVWRGHGPAALPLPRQLPRQPRRDAAAREHLDAVARGARPSCWRAIGRWRWPRAGWPRSCPAVWSSGARCCGWQASQARGPPPLPSSSRLRSPRWGSGPQRSISTARSARAPPGRPGWRSNGSRWSGGFPPPAGPPWWPRCSTA